MPTATVPFESQGKALTTTPTSEGNLAIRGWAARYDTGRDREGDVFADGVLSAAVAKALDGNLPLLWQHSRASVLGRVDRLEHVQGKGLWLEGTVLKQSEASPLHSAWTAIKHRAAKGLSIGGWFRRALLPDGYKIVQVDLAEVSCCGIPMGGHETAFAVTGTKSLTDNPQLARLRVERDQLNALDHAADLLDLRADWALRPRRR